MIFRPFVFILLATITTLSLSVTGWCEEKSQDLSAGIVFPSNNSAVFENPAALGAFSGGSLDAGGGKDSTGIYGVTSYARSGSGKGFGIGLTQWQNETSVTAAGGWSFGMVELGLNGTYDLTPKTISVDAGLRSQMGGLLTLAVVLDNITRFNNRWTLGLGAELSKNFHLETDLTFQHGSDLTTIEYLTGRIGVSFHQTRTVSVEVGVPYDVYPSAKVHLSDPELGLSFWLGNSFALYGLYNPPGATYLVGIKIQ